MDAKLTQRARPLLWPAAIEAIRNTISPADDVYIVGGAVRDAFLHRPLHDIDLATPRDGRPIARHIADVFDGVYYTLDAERRVGRALISFNDMHWTVDVAQFRGHDLEADLRLRDFTLNAMAVQLAGDLQIIVDPLGGLQDLSNKVLRECSPDSIQNDPVRALRAVRTSIKYGCSIESSTRNHIRRFAPELTRISVERVRDEFFAILDGDKLAAAMSVLVHLDLLENILPELTTLTGIQQSPPHQYDVWDHTLLTVDRLSLLLRLFAPNHDDNLTGSMAFALLSQAVRPYLSQLRSHMSQKWPNDRTHRALLILSALLHDSGKAQTRSVDATGNTHFYQHEQVGSTLAQARSMALRLSRDETHHITTIIRHHMRPHWLHATQPLTPRAIYRFWRDTGPAGIDICLLGLADYLATYGTSLGTAQWVDYLQTIQTLLDAYFFHRDTHVVPPPILTGQDLIKHFRLQPGPHIGELLEHIREAQVEGTLTTYDDALAWVQQLLDRDASQH